MLWNRYFLPSLIMLVLVAALHRLASDLFFYWTVWWYDIMMHFLGGAWVALSVLWVLEMPIVSAIRGRFSLTSVILLSLIVGVLWEVFELMVGFSDPAMAGYVMDTVIDLVMDTLGAGLVVFLSARLNRNK